MSLSREQIGAIFKLYPQVTLTRGDEAFDADGNKVEYDLQAVINQANLEQQTAENHKQSAMAKLTAIGLTEAEINALIG
jgi:hypothetical protein